MASTCSSSARDECFSEEVFIVPGQVYIGQDHQLVLLDEQLGRVVLRHPPIPRISHALLVNLLPASLRFHLSLPTSTP